VPKIWHDAYERARRLVQKIRGKDCRLGFRIEERVGDEDELKAS
jgi:hypothetical protein